LKNLPSLDHIPAIFDEKVFQKAFHTAEIAAMPENEREIYQHNLNDYRTYLATLETAEKKGNVKGRSEGRAERETEIVKNLKTLGLSQSDIAKATGLSFDEIEKISSSE
jgi:predicted transposase/invertase (TIGR01784 family)